MQRNHFLVDKRGLGSCVTRSNLTKCDLDPCHTRHPKQDKGLEISGAVDIYLRCSRLELKQKQAQTDEV